MPNQTTTFVGKIIGSRLAIKSDRWSSVYVYEPTIERVAKARGNLYIVLDLAKDYEELGTQIINTIREKYYHELELDPLQSMESALSYANKAITDYSQKIVTLKQETLQQINVACVVLCNSDLHLAQIGEIHTYLIRKGRLNKISNVSPNSRSEAESFQNIASGKIEIGDIVTISTPKLFDILPINQFKKITTSCYPSVAASRISEIITQKSTEGIAPSVLVLEINSEKADAQADQTDTQPKEKSLQNQLKVEKDEIADKIAQDADIVPPAIEQHVPVHEPLPHRPTVRPDSTPRARRERNPILGAVSDTIKLTGKVISGEEDISKLSKLFLMIGIILVAIVGFKILTSGSKSNPVVETSQAYEQAWDNYTKAREVLRNNDFVNAREYLLAAKTKAEEAHDLNIFPEETQQLIADIQIDLDSLDGVTRLTDISPLADLASLADDANPIDLEVTADSFYIFDKDAQKIYRLTKDNFQVVLATEELFVSSTADLMTAADNKLFLYSGSGDTPKLAQFDPETDSFNELEVVFENNWKNASYITSWTDVGGNYRLYLADPVENAFWRYRLAGTQYSTPEDYFVNTDTIPDMSKVVDITIDGNVFFLSSEGEVLKYELSQLNADFELRGLKVPLSDPTAMVSETPNQSVSTELGKKLYIADKGNSRILIVGKEDGQLAKIYAATGAFDDLRDLVVDELNDFLYVLDGTKIYRIQI